VYCDADLIEHNIEREHDWLHGDAGQCLQTIHGKDDTNDRQCTLCLILHTIFPRLDIQCGGGSPCNNCKTLLTPCIVAPTIPKADCFACLICVLSGRNRSGIPYRFAVPVYSNTGIKKERHACLECMSNGQSCTLFTDRIYPIEIIRMLSPSDLIPIRVDKDDNNRFLCSYCDSSFDDVVGWRFHISRHSFGQECYCRFYWAFAHERRRHIRRCSKSRGALRLLTPGEHSGDLEIDYGKSLLATRSRDTSSRTVTKAQFEVSGGYRIPNLHDYAHIIVCDRMSTHWLVVSSTHASAAGPEMITSIIKQAWILAFF